MANFNFYLKQPYVSQKSNEKQQPKHDKKRLNPNETRVYLYVTKSRREIIRLKTEIKILPKLWDFKNGKVKDQAINSKYINDLLTKYKDKIERLYNEIRTEHPNRNFKDIKNELETFNKTGTSPFYDEKNKTFFDAFDEFLEIKEREYAPRTIQKFKTLKNSLESFDKYLTFEKIDLRFYDKYKNHLQTKKATGRQKTREEGKQDGLLNATTAKYISSLKSFMNWSLERKYHTNIEFLKKSFDAKRTLKNKPKEEIVTLRINELKKLYNHDLSQNKRLEKIKDVFCFACFTGQRWSDIERFNKKDIHGNWWSFTSYKTGDEINVSLIGYMEPAMEILKKYNFDLPIISSQKFNEYLKQVGEIAGLNRVVKVTRYSGQKEIITERPLYKFMSSHMGRRTCVSLLLNVENMPINQVMEITGHKDFKTLSKYLDKDKEALENSISKTKGIYSDIIHLNTGT